MNYFILFFSTKGMIFTPTIFGFSVRPFQIIRLNLIWYPYCSKNNTKGSPVILNQIAQLSRVLVAFGLVSYLNMNTNDIRSVQKKALVFGSHWTTPGHPYWMHLCRLQYINATHRQTKCIVYAHRESDMQKDMLCIPYFFIQLWLEHWFYFGTRQKHQKQYTHENITPAVTLSSRHWINFPVSWFWLEFSRFSNNNFTGKFDMTSESVCCVTIPCTNNDCNHKNYNFYLNLWFEIFIICSNLHYNFITRILLANFVLGKIKEAL